MPLYNTICPTVSHTLEKCIGPIGDKFGPVVRAHHAVGQGELDLGVLHGKEDVVN